MPVFVSELNVYSYLILDPVTQPQIFEPDLTTDQSKTSSSCTSKFWMSSIIFAVSSGGLPKSEILTPFVSINPFTLLPFASPISTVLKFAISNEVYGNENFNRFIDSYTLY